jgi:fatty-acyl-CoA synthase
VPDQKYGEQLCACIILRPGMQTDAEEIRSFCSGQIAHYKIPHYIVFVDSFPMTVTGKIQKHLLQKKVTNDLNLSAE